MPKVIISFDTEDFVTPEASQGVEHMMDLLEKHGFTGNFCVVAELARLWQQLGRSDLITRMSERHVVAYHSSRHSVPPLDVDLVSDIDFLTGVRRVMEDERTGKEFVEGLFGQSSVAYVVPGFDWSAQSVWAMKQLGIPLFVNEGLKMGRAGKPVWMCNTLIGNYDLGLDAFFGRANWVEALWAKIADLLDTRTEEDFVILYMHPNMMITREFSDSLNFGGGRNPSPQNWEQPPLRTESEIQEIIAGLDSVLERLAQREDAVAATYHDLLAAYGRTENVNVPWEEVDALVSQWLAYKEGQEAAGLWADISAADLLATLATAYAKDGYHELALEAKVVRALGPLSAPHVNSPGSIDEDQLLPLASLVVDAVQKGAAIPGTISLDGLELGPDAALTVLAQAYVQARQNRTSSAELSWGETNELPPFGLTPYFRKLGLSGKWPIFRSDFDDTSLVQHLRWQSWSLSQAKFALR